MASDSKPAADQVLAMMRNTMGSIPSAIEKATSVDEGLLYEHLRSRAYAMPAEGALDDETRTLIYLAAALAASSKACIQAMANKAKMQGIAPEKGVGDREDRAARPGNESYRRWRADFRGARKR